MDRRAILRVADLEVIEVSKPLGEGAVTLHLAAIRLRHPFRVLFGQQREAVETFAFKAGEHHKIGPQLREQALIPFHPLPRV